MPDQPVLLNNFQAHLPAYQSHLAEEVFRDSLDFSFATVRNEEYDERDLEEALCRNISDLLLELGTGFAFIARQKEIIVAGTSRRIDLLFYHIRLRCYVVVELKARSFQPEYAGKLNFYVNAVNHLIRKEEDNPTIGLLVCSDMKETEVKWSFEGLTTPIGVASYHGVRILDALPSEEQLQTSIRQMNILAKKV